MARTGAGGCATHIVNTRLSAALAELFAVIVCPSRRRAPLSAGMSRPPPPPSPWSRRIPQRGVILAPQTVFPSCPQRCSS